MKTLFLFRGLPGAGKTTAAEMLAEDLYPIYSADDYFTDDHGNYNFDASKLYHAHKQCQERTELAMSSSSYKISVANTFTTEKEMRPYFEMALKWGYRVVCLIVENRHHSKSVHDVPCETIEKMKARFAIQL